MYPSSDDHSNYMLGLSKLACVLRLSGPWAVLLGPRTNQVVAKGGMGHDLRVHDYIR